MERYIDYIIKKAEMISTDFIKNQEKDQDRIDYGSLKGDIVDVKPTVFKMTEAVCVYLHKDSIYYQNVQLYDALILGLDFVKRLQREDGSFDYPSCNFKSAPDTSFCFKGLMASYDLLKKYGTNEKTEVLADKFLIILKDALLGILNGGFHTPNHRWAITAALMQGCRLQKGQEIVKDYQERIQEYLAEGIDGNEDGEYAERSTGNYNAVVNMALITMYEESKDESYLQYVKRNLEMMLTYVDPDDTIFTQNSTRQDQGVASYLDLYFYQYLYMASFYKNELFDGVAHKIIKDIVERGGNVPECLHMIMLYDMMEQHHFTQYGYLDEYRKHYKDAGVIRVKTPKFTYSILKDKSSFLFFKVNDTPIYIRIGASLCETRSFKPQKMEFCDKETILSYRANGWYYLPFKEKLETNDWWKMDHKKRELQVSSQLDMTVHISEKEDGIDLLIKTNGIDLLPVRVEVCIPSGSIVENKEFYLKAEKAGSMILRNGYVQVHHKDQTIEVGPGFGSHQFQGHYSGEERNDMGYTIFMNEYTNFERTITFRVK